MRLKVMTHPVTSRGLAEQKPIDANVAGSISWERMVDQLRSAGEFKASETVEALVLTDDGIHYYVKRR